MISGKDVWNGYTYYKLKHDSTATNEEIKEGIIAAINDAARIQFYSYFPGWERVKKIVSDVIKENDYRYININEINYVENGLYNCEEIHFNYNIIRNISDIGDDLRKELTDLIFAGFADRCEEINVTKYGIMSSVISEFCRSIKPNYVKEYVVNGTSTEINYEKIIKAKKIYKIVYAIRNIRRGNNAETPDRILRCVNGQLIEPDRIYKCINGKLELFWEK